MDANEPIPYYAGLAKVLRGPTLALVLTYLEWHHPTPGSTPQDSPEALYGLDNAPAIIDCEVACVALGVSNRTLHVALSCLCCWWSTEELRSRAARADREFINPAHSLKPKGYGQIKPYSVTGSKCWSRPRTLAIRRNWSKLTQILASAGIIEPITHIANPITDNDDLCKPSSFVHSLPDILLSTLPDWGDRRRERWERWRRENGKKSRNPGRMRGAKIVVSSTDGYISD